MTLGLAVTKQHFFRHMYVAQLFPRRTFRFTPLIFNTDLTKWGAPLIPYGAIIELSFTDGAILIGLGRQLIPEEELELVNMETWGDAFQDGSTLSFLEKMILGSEEKKENDVEQHLNAICRIWNARSALCAKGIQNISQEILDAAGLNKDMLTTNLRSHHLRTLLDKLASVMNFD